MASASDLLDRFAQIPDTRYLRWVDHPLTVVLALCAGAVAAGMCSFTAAAGWVADVPAEVLSRVYTRCGVGPPVRAPSKTTLWRVATEVDAALVDEAVGAWLADRAGLTVLAPAVCAETPTCGDDQSAEPDAQTVDQVALVAVAVDGKTLRGATDADGNQVHLLAAATHDDRLVLAQTDVAAKRTRSRCYRSCSTG